MIMTILDWTDQNSFMQMHTILAEMVVGGQVVETNSDIVMKAVEEISM